MRENHEHHHHHHHHGGPDSGPAETRDAGFGDGGGPDGRDSRDRRFGGRPDADGQGRGPRGRGPRGDRGRNPGGRARWDGPEDSPLQAELRHLHGAVRGLRHSGDPGQQARAQQILADARRHLYMLLAEQPTGEQPTGERSPEGAADPTAGEAGEALNPAETGSTTGQVG